MVCIFNGSVSEFRILGGKIAVLEIGSEAFIESIPDTGTQLVCKDRGITASIQEAYNIGIDQQPKIPFFVSFVLWFVCVCGNPSITIFTLLAAQPYLPSRLYHHMRSGQLTEKRKEDPDIEKGCVLIFFLS
jgi:hypothetical protein